jgi:hypothetical protein
VHVQVKDSDVEAGLSLTALDRVIRQAEALTPDEQLRLIAHVAERMRASQQPEVARRKWSEISGAAPYPLMGEDAQDWVQRTRREDASHRDQSLGR